MFGSDDKGSFYKNIDEMWQSQLKGVTPHYKVKNPVGSLQAWYRKANDYWNKAEATYDGVLSGFGNLSSKDIQGSEGFLQQLRQEHSNLNLGSIIDCGAGIGRISKELFCRYFAKVDVIDQCQKYIEKAKQYLKEETTVRHFYCKGLQEFNFEEKYDIIWIQWVLSHLTDEDAINFFKKAKSSLNEHGVIVLKQNHSEKGFLVDKDDYSVTRSSEMYQTLFKKAGLTILKQKLQKDWPQDLFDVKMYALI